MLESKIYRILDANINRAMEGLRVVEEVVRFVLDDKELTSELKSLRSELQAAVKEIPQIKLLNSRRALSDVGAKLYSKTEARRPDLGQVLTSNLKRTQEAVRSLEEFSKLLKSSYGKLFKRIRFKLYDLERVILLRFIRDSKIKAGLYVVTDPALGHIQTIKRALKNKVPMIQLRDKRASKKEYLKLARRARKLILGKAVFIINDYVDIAKKVAADGVHLGQDDISPRQARKLLGDDYLIGVSTHNLGQAKRAQKEGADYISVGPIFKTPSKPGVKPLGVALLGRIRQKIKIPIVAIGGINNHNVKKILRAGVMRVAVIRSADRARSIAKNIQGYD